MKTEERTAPSVSWSGQPQPRGAARATGRAGPVSEAAGLRNQQVLAGSYVGVTVVGLHGHHLDPQPLGEAGFIIRASQRRLWA